MNQKQFSAFFHQLNAGLDERTLTELARKSGFCQRKRAIEPFQLLLCLITTLACERTESVADIHRRFVEWSKRDVTYRAMRNQLTKHDFPDFMRQALSYLLRQWLGPALAFPADSPFSRFHRVLAQDGSSFALNDSLHHHFPGRFSEVSPAAVELHVTMDLLADQPCRISLTPDTASERGQLPEPESLAGDLILLDRGYFDLTAFQRMTEVGCHFIVRCLNDVNPMVDEGWREDGKSLRSVKGKYLKDINGKLLRRQRNELLVHWKRPGKGEFHARLIAFWNQEEKRYSWLMTNLPREDFSLADISDAYRLRWQIELLFKELKSYANLHRFDTGNRYIAEGLIWASIMAALLKRFISNSAQRLAGVALSSRKTAMSCHSTITQLLLQIMRRRTAQSKVIARRLMEFLAQYARRAHPKRDQKTGRSKLGLGVFVTA